MSTLKVTNLQHPSSASANVTLDASGNADFNGKNLAGVASVNGGQLGDRNILINGGLTVSQRGDYTSATSFANDNYYLDRWKMWLTGVTGTVQQTTVTINGVTKKAMKIVATSSATGYIGTRQTIELQNIPVGETLVASCWVRSNNANTRLRSNDLGGSDSNSPDLTNDGNWEKVSWSIDSSGTTVNPTMGIIMFSDAGQVSITSGDYIEFTDFQLEVSSDGTATEFQHESYGTTLQKCQRYFEVTGVDQEIYCNAALYTATAAFGLWQFNVPKRATPSAGRQLGLASDYRVRSNGVSYACVSLTISDATTYNCRVDTSMSNSFTSGHAGWISHLSNSTQLYADAEL